MGYAHAVIATLIDLGYAAHTKAYKIKVVNPTLLLKRWAAYHQYDKANTFFEYYTFEQEVERFIYRLSTITSIPYALTGLAGAFLVAPHVRPVDVHMYVHREDVETLAEILGLQPIPRGGNVKFVIPYDEGVYYGQQRVNIQVSNQVVSKVTVVSNVQLFVDLYNYPARGLEAAENLYRQIVNKWGKELIGE